MLVFINIFLNVLGTILMAAVALFLSSLAYELWSWRRRKAKWGRRLDDYSNRLNMLELKFYRWDQKPLPEKNNFKKTGAAQVSKATRVTPKTSNRPFRAVVRVNQVSER